jgi:nitroimidazol reductase NimA-like FMN-containing flavoprotein (pyridoxamine 5'-phosphate oxidase superfamily)
MDTAFPVTGRNKLLRLAKRGSYDRDEVYAVVDASLICHVAYAIGDQPYVLPTLYARDGDTILLHGHGSSRTLLHAGDGQPVCIAFTHVDGVVLARSIFNHSINYRSATLYGSGRLLTNRDEKLDALYRFSEKLLPGRWDDVRPMTDQEFKATAIVAVAVEDASAKIRTGPPVDDLEDLTFPTWAGVLPLRETTEAPIPDDHTPASTPVPPYVADWIEARTGSG